jgi:hypothetical protein
VTDPATQQIHAVDILTGEVWKSATLTVTPNELTSASGAVVEHAALEHDHADDDEHGHDEHDHEHEDDAHQG